MPSAGFPLFTKIWIDHPQDPRPDNPAWPLSVVRRHYFDPKVRRRSEKFLPPKGHLANYHVSNSDPIGTDPHPKLGYHLEAQPLVTLDKPGCNPLVRSRVFVSPRFAPAS